MQDTAPVVLGLWAPELQNSVAYVAYVTLKSGWSNRCGKVTTAYPVGRVGEKRYRSKHARKLTQTFTMHLALISITIIIIEKDQPHTGQAPVLLCCSDS